MDKVLISDIEFDPKPWDQSADLILESMRDTSVMINPVTLVAGTNGKPYKLEAGNIRLQSAIKLGWTEVPYTLLEAGQSLDMHIHENLMRRQMDWPEEVALLAEYHRKKQEVHGVAKRGRKTEGEEPTAWRLQDTADAVQKSIGRVHNDISLHDALLRNPGLAKVKDKKTALKLIKSQAKRMDREAEALMPSDWSTEFTGYNQCLNGDSSELLKYIPANTFDCCITDPPWSQYKDEKLTADDSTTKVFAEIYRVLKPNSMFYCIVSTTDFIAWCPLLIKLGFKVQQYPLIWQKIRTITHGRRNWEYARDYEPIIVAAKGDAMLTSSTEKTSILNYPNLNHVHMIHPHEKPVELINQLIDDSTYPGGAILDPFGGSGVVADCARRRERKYLTIERDPEFYLGILNRLSKSIKEDTNA
jgi:site-specific DNA-methyltransferase (adenine-specific)